ncbi:MAG: 3-dehydroquinate synthase [Bacteroidales bacterium]|nr:3-dehydroquinate synthase [Bacteroidales bacterium]
MQAVTEIIVDGKVLSRVVSGPNPADVAGCLANYRKVWMVYDENVASHAARIEVVLRQSGKLAAAHSLHVSEESKTIETVLSLEDWLLATGADRDALLLAVGGGITTDMAGFAASVYKRGIRFAFVPTTLLAQVDAAIGGKTGVNFHYLKNMLGVIHQPDFTYLCPEVLETLPARDFRSGASEMLKTFIIEDGGNYEKAVMVLSDIASGASIASQRKDLQQLISAAAAVKAGIVSRDQFESGERRKLNLGHTFAHAIEWKARESGSDITHGEAVAIGIIQAAKLTDRALADRLSEDFSRAGLPTALPFPLATLADAMLKDKKAEGGKVHFVLIKSIGDVYTEDMTVAEAIAKL